MTSYFKTLFASLFNEGDTEDLAGQKNEEYEIPYEEEELNSDSPSAEVNKEIAQLCDAYKEGKNYCSFFPQSTSIIKRVQYFRAFDGL